MIHRLYRLTTHWAGPAINWYLHRRLQRGKEDHARFPERKGHATRPRPPGPLTNRIANSLSNVASE